MSKLDEDFEKMKKSAYEYCVERRYDILTEVKELEKELKELNEVIEKYEEEAKV